MSKSLIPVLGFCFAASLSVNAAADTFVLPPPDVDVVGQVRVVNARHEDTLLDIARAYGVGYEEIVAANPGVDRWLPGEGTPVVVPSRYVLPNAPREGIVLNVPEMRLYYYPKAAKGEKPKVITHPVSIGRMDWNTPLGKTKIISKIKDPTWTPPASIKKEHAERGDILPNVVPAGPDNPLGQFALRLGVPGYLIHGTNKPSGVGMRVSHGCVRMFPEDIEALFTMVSKGEKVNIVNQPLKVGRLAGTIFLEFHQPLEEEDPGLEQNQQLALSTAEDISRQWGETIDADTVRLVVQQAGGLPAAVGQQ